MNKENDFILVREFYDFLLDIKSNKNLSELDDLFYLFKDIKINSQSIYEYNVYYYLIKILISEDIEVLSSSNYYEMSEEELSSLPLDIQLSLREHFNNTLILHINNFSIKNEKIRPDLVIGKGNKKIVIELDSFKYHSDPNQLMKDKQRERIIQALGYPVYRFSNKEIIENLGGVINEIINIIKRELGISNSISKDNTDNFNSFWEMYPTRRTNKEKCRIKFNKLSKEEQFQILLDVKMRKDRDEKWLKGFVPETITYLNNRKWEDDIQEVLINEDDQIINDIILVFKESGISIPDKVKEDKIEKSACIELHNSKGIEKVRNILEYCMENKVFYNFTTPNKLLTNYEAIRLSKINKDKK